MEFFLLLLIKHYRGLRREIQEGISRGVCRREMNKGKVHVASYADALWACHAIFLTHKRLLKPRAHSLLCPD